MNDTQKIPLHDLQNDLISEENKIKIKGALDSDMPTYLNNAEALEKQIAQVFDTNSTDVFPALTALLPDGIDDRVKSHVTQVILDYLEDLNKEPHQPNLGKLQGIFRRNAKLTNLDDDAWFENAETVKPNELSLDDIPQTPFLDQGVTPGRTPGIEIEFDFTEDPEDPDETVSPSAVLSGKTALSEEDLDKIEQSLMTPTQRLWKASTEGRSNILQPAGEFGEDVETIVPRAKYSTDYNSLPPLSSDSGLDLSFSPQLNTLPFSPGMDATRRFESVDPVGDPGHLHTNLDSGLVWEIDTDESAQDVLESLMEQEFDLNEYTDGSVRMRARKGRDGANLRVFAETLALEVLEELVSESRGDGSLQAVHRAIEEKMRGHIGMSDEALVALAIYFNVRGDVGTEKFEKEMSSKLVTVVGEELGLDFDVDMDEVEVENGFSGHNLMFKQKMYQKLYAKYANEDLRDPEVRNRFTNELTLGMMQERLRLLQEREDHLQNNWSNKAMNGLRATARFLKQVGGPAALTLLLGASAYYGGIGTTLTGLGKLVTGIGTEAGTASLASLVGDYFGMLGFKGAYGIGAAYMGGKTLSAFAKLKMPLMGLFGASAHNLDQNMLEMINAGASLRIGNDGLQVANMDESSKARRSKIKDIKKTFRQELKATRKNAVQSLKDSEYGTRSEAIMSTINSTYRSVIDMQSIGDTKLDGTKEFGEWTSIGSSVAMFGLPSLFSLGYRKMRA